MIRLAFVILLCLSMSASRTWAEARDLAPAWATALSAFDDAAKAKQSNSPHASKLLDTAAARLNELLSSPLSDHDRARVLYNLAVIEQLRPNHARALPLLLQAESVFPALPGLAERLHAARQALQETDAPKDIFKPLPVSAQLTNLAHSMPRPWHWWCMLFAWALLWFALTGSLFLRRKSLLLVLAGLIALFWLAATAWLFLIESRLQGFRAQHVLISESAPRDQPDALIGSSTGASLKPGTAVHVLDTRIGSDAAPWALATLSLASTETFWIPESAIAPVLPPQTAFQFDRVRSILDRGPAPQTP